MSNQASEDKLYIRIKELLIALLLTNQRDPDGIDEYVDFCIRDTKKLIRTEKLKLLAEVRERVVGEDDETIKAPLVTKRLQIIDRNMLRLEQRGQLTKLEAEL